VAAVTLCHCQRALIKHVSRSRDFARFQLTELRTFYTVTPEVKLKSHKLSRLTYLNSPLRGNYRASQTLVKNCSVNSSHVVTTGTWRSLEYQVTGTEVNSAWAIPSWVGARLSTKWELGELTGTSRDTSARIRGLAVLAVVWLRTSVEVREAVAYQRLFATMCHTDPHLFYLLTYLVQKAGKYKPQTVKY